MKNKKTLPAKYEPTILEEKWQKVWEEKGVYHVDIENAKNPFYNLMMFPYPSAEGLHVGNMYAFTGTDIYGRFQRMNGKDVLEPIGLDGFGIHSENYAIKVGRTPKEHAAISEKNFYRQLHLIGNGFDWERKVETYDPKYYKWTQWLFIQLFNQGLAYRKKAPVNFCPKDLTVLADEQVIDGKCERCGTEVEKRNLEQWFFQITKYADRLLENIEGLDWSDKVRIAQRNWIGKKEGINITYPIEGTKETVTVFTTRPDTNFGATFIALAPENPLITKITTSEHKQEVEEYIKAASQKSDIERQAEGKEKTGVFTGSYAINHLTGYKMPIWVSDFVLMGFGTGALVGVPGHDKRDFEFATKFHLEIKRVVVGSDNDKSSITTMEQVQEDEGTMINSDFLNGMDIHKATEKIMDYIEEKGWGERVATYHLRDWLISRQRYWGPPIPLINCPKCGWQPVPEKDLPVLLPDVENWKPTGTGESPLAQLTDWINTTCPKCLGAAKRETDVSDTFLDSAWYFFRYTSTDIDSAAFDTKRVKKWLPVTMYIGGAEHSVLHLLYSRFVTMVLSDMKLIGFEEPFAKFRAHGLIIKDGAKMSKSKGNVVVPDAYIKKFGADTLRSYLMFLGPFSQGGDFSDSGIEGMHRFLKRVWFLAHEFTENPSEEQLSDDSLRIMHKTIKKATEEISSLRYNTAIAALMEWYNFLSSRIKTEGKLLTKQELATFVKLLAPFAPHMTEEIWQSVSINDSQFSSLHKQSWPTFEEKYLAESSITVVIQVNGKVRDNMIIASGMDKKQVEEQALSLERIKKYTEGKQIVKIIYVQNKLINIVIKE
ncbi:MAG TPA: leucine--tRNA ligase [Patescibacteria group bacterium]